MVSRECLRSGGRDYYFDFTTGWLDGRSLDGGGASG